MNNSFGLYDNSFSLLLKTLADFPQIEKAWVFGSRALGNYKKGSDIDIAIAGSEVNFDTVAKLYGVLNEEQPIPYFVDVVDYNALQSARLQQHIEEKGVVFYDKKVGNDKGE